METFSLFIYALNHVLRSAKVNLCLALAHIEQQNMAASRLSKRTYYSRVTSIQSVEVFKKNSWSVGIRGE